MTTATRGRSLHLYFIEGKPDGMLTAEVFNWTGHVLMTPRTRIAEALKRDQAQFTGVYLLLGEGEGEAQLYIGEADNVSDRIRSHAINKDWWDTAILITSSANSLNKAHVRYLESRLIEVGRSVGRVKLDNSNSTSRPSLSESAQADMETYLDYIFMILPALRINAFVQQARPSSPEKTSEESASTKPLFELHTTKHGLHATARLEDDEFVVLQGSTARRTWAGRTTQDTGYARLHAELRETGVLQEQGDHCVFTTNYAFKSPSAAAAVVHGRPANGTTEWKIGGQTYKEWEAARLATQQPADAE